MSSTYIPLHLLLLPLFPLPVLILLVLLFLVLLVSSASPNFPLSHPLFCFFPPPPPPPILLMTLSFLSVSRSWHRLWAMMPFLAIHWPSPLSNPPSPILPLPPLPNPQSPLLYPLHPLTFDAILPLPPLPSPQCIKNFQILAWLWLLQILIWHCSQCRN